MDSLIQEQRAEEQKQPMLLDVPAEAEADAKASGTYTGELLHRSRPATYQAIVRCLGNGMGIRQTARALRVSHHTVIAVRDREGCEIAAQKKQLSGVLRSFATLAAERMVEELDDIPVDKLAIPLGIAVDKMQILDGEATSIVGHVHSDRRVDDLAAVLAALPEAKGKVIDAGGTGFDGETNPQKVAAGPVLPEPDGADRDAGLTRATDM